MTRYLTLLAAGLALSTSANAVPVLYNAGDAGASAGSARPNSDATAAAFDSAAGALGSTNLIDFDSLSTGYSANMTLDSNTTAAFTGDIATGASGIDSSNSTTLGYNTTAGGGNHLRFAPTFGWSEAGLTLSFDNPVQAFGGYFTGVDSTINGTVDVMFNDGSAQNFSLLDLAGGGIQFFGIVDAGTSISSIVFNEINTNPGVRQRDIWGLDDFRYVTSSVPEASSLALFAVGLIGIGLSSRRRSR